MVYEKSNRSPPAGSLREALFLTVWLKRQEVEFYKTRAIFHAIALSESNDRKPISEAYKDYFDAVFPFAAGAREESDQKTREALERIAKMGPIEFKIARDSPLMKRAKDLSKPDEFRRSLMKKRNLLR